MAEIYINHAYISGKTQFLKNIFHLFKHFRTVLVLLLTSEHLSIVSMSTENSEIIDLFLSPIENITISWWSYQFII